RHTRFSRDWSSDVCSSDLAVLLKRRRRLVDPLGHAEVLDVHLAGAAARRDMRGAALAHSPRPGENIDLVLVDIVRRFAFDIRELQKHVNSHGTPPSVWLRAQMP